MVLCVPHYFSGHDRLVKTELYKLSSVFRYMRCRALVTGKIGTITFSQDGYGAAGKEQLHKKVRLGVAKKIKGPPSAPTRVITTVTTWPDNTVHFYPEGTIQAGSVYMSAQDGSGIYALTIDASAWSGIRLYTYAGCWRQI